jgi:hypothetical protein
MTEKVWLRFLWTLLHLYWHCLLAAFDRNECPLSNKLYSHFSFFTDIFSKLFHIDDFCSVIINVNSKDHQYIIRSFNIVMSDAKRSKLSVTSFSSHPAPVNPEQPNSQGDAKNRAPANHHIAAPEFGPERIREAIHALKSGQEEVVIIDAGVISDCPGIEMVRYWNARVKAKYRVPVPETWPDINLKDYGGLPGISGGMWHTYASSAHDTAIDTEVIDVLFSEMTDTPHWQIRPNRIRFNGKHSDDGYQSAHIEGPNILIDECDISSILCMTAGRTFTYYRGSNNDPRARELFCQLGGESSLFVQPKSHQLVHWQRTTIQTTKSGQIILFADSVAHEISLLNANSLSLFLSPYDPGKVVSEVQYYQGLTRKEATQKKKDAQKSPPLPVHLRTPGVARQHPKEYVDMSRRDTEIFGSLFHSTGAYWPSDKPTFFLFHMMAFNAFKPKLLSFMFDRDGKYNYELITPEVVDGCAEFDQEYFSHLPMVDCTEAEIHELRAKFTGIPAAAWPLVKYWTKDIRQCSENVCKRRGYIE